MLVRQPGLTLVATLALGIGIPAGALPLHNVDALTMQPPVRDGNEIVILRNYDLTESRPVMSSVHDFVQWREELTSFEHLGLTKRRGLYNVLSEDGRAARSPAPSSARRSSLCSVSNRSSVGRSSRRTRPSARRTSS